MSKPEIIRCLKRYIAREIYTALLDPPPSSVPAITSTAPEEPSAERPQHSEDERR